MHNRQAVIFSLNKREVKVPSICIQEQDKNIVKNRYIEMIFASWCSGKGAMPTKLGMQPQQFEKFLDHFELPKDWSYHQQLAVKMGEDRSEEIQELYSLLLKQRTHGTETEAWIAWLVAVGSMGSDHLWSDLGLSKRSDLTAMLLANFYPLAKKNNWDMKWKKFLYRQLCETKRGALCLAPTCEECIDYDECYSIES